PPCKAFGPRYAARAAASEALLCTVDVDNAGTAALCKTFEVKCMPTVIKFVGGALAEKMEGINAEKFETWADGH
ncbi:hypothetical protein M885DRAFT_433288, partial [Pelagophyceae sp. CCMP2097]